MSTVDALLVEREGYVRRGLRNRVAEVDAEIARLSGGVVVVDDDGLETTDATPFRRGRR